MLKQIITLSTFLIPTTVLAMSWSQETAFIDVKKTSPEAVAVHLLTEEGVITKKENGRFYSSRLINRAEFLKMALASRGVKQEETSPSQCFSDVPKNAWFAPFVCQAKQEGIITGVGTRFFPERPVQYDEALKMMTLLYGYPVDRTASKDWATPYYNVAKNRGVDLSQRIRFDTRLTRGMAARLIAAFLAESRGELINLRLAESGNFDLISVSQSSSSSSSSSTSSTSSISSSTASSVSSESSSASSSPSLRSHFLSLGTLSAPLASIIIPARAEKQSVALARVVLVNEMRSMSSLQIVREDGTVVATLLQRVTADLSGYKKIYEVQVPEENQVVLAPNTAQTLFLRANVRSAVEGGISDELLSIQSFSVTLRTENNQTANIIAEPPFFKHQTTFGVSPSLQKIALPSNAIRAGTGKTLYQLSATVPDIPAREFALRQIQWNVQAQDVTLSNITLTRGSLSTDCSMNTNEMVITCILTQSTAGLLSSSQTSPFVLKADVTLDASKSSGALVLSLPRTGSPSELGNIQWTDGSGKFQWVEQDTPVLPSEIITVTK